MKLVLEQATKKSPWESAGGRDPKEALEAIARLAGGMEVNMKVVVATRDASWDAEPHRFRIVHTLTLCCHRCTRLSVYIIVLSIVVFVVVLFAASFVATLA